MSVADRPPIHLAVVLGEAGGHVGVAPQGIASGLPLAQSPISVDGERISVRMVDRPGAQRRNDQDQEDLADLALSGKVRAGEDVDEDPDEDPDRHEPAGEDERRPEPVAERRIETPL